MFFDYDIMYASGDESLLKFRVKELTDYVNKLIVNTRDD